MSLLFIISGFVLGFAGSLHCVGMCGPIALALPIGSMNSGRKLMSILTYNIGRATTYFALGLVFGLLGLGVVLAGYQQSLTISLGILLLIITFFPFLAKRSDFISRFFYSLSAKLKSAFASVLGRKSITAIFITGVLNGLLPCGFVYIAAAGATASGSILLGALFMAAFGLGTLPAMFSVSFFSSTLPARFKSRLSNLSPVLAAGMAVLLILRGLNLGIPLISPVMSKENNEEHACCHKPVDNKNNAAEYGQ